MHRCLQVLHRLSWSIELWQNTFYVLRCTHATCRACATRWSSCCSAATRLLHRSPARRPRRSVRHRGSSSSQSRRTISTYSCVALLVQVLLYVYRRYSYRLTNQLRNVLRQFTLKLNISGSSRPQAELRRFSCSDCEFGMRSPHPSRSLSRGARATSVSVCVHSDSMLCCVLMCRCVLCAPA